MLAFRGTAHFTLLGLGFGFLTGDAADDAFSSWMAGVPLVCPLAALLLLPALAAVAAAAAATAAVRDAAAAAAAAALDAVTGGGICGALNGEFRLLFRDPLMLWLLLWLLLLLLLLLLHAALV